MDIELPVLGVADGDLRHRQRRQFCWEQFVIAHELSHILLGHLGSTGSPTALRYARERVDEYRTLPTWSMLTDDSQRAESEADLFGLFELCYGASLEVSQRKGISAGAPGTAGSDITSPMRGEFRDKPEARTGFLQLAT